MPKRNPAAGNETPAKTANFRADSSPQAQQTKPVLDPNLCVACFNATGDASHCPHCGWNALSVPAAASHLIPGTVLGDSYIIGQVLGHGGFGITYLGWNHKLRIPVAIKEFLPDHIARRDANRTTISLYSGYDELFADGLIKFQEEAQALAKFQQHPGIITVYGTMTTNGTGYMVMEYINGITLKQYLADTSGKKIPWADAIAIMAPVMDALRTVHAAKLLHRDIAPDNIYLTTDHRVKLLDFGAARQTIGEQSKSLSIILKEGFAPEEQYRRKGKQGAWTDVYGVAATLYYCIVGAVPLSALDRMSCDELKPPSALGIAIAPKHEAALMRGLAVRAEDRWQSMEEMQQQLVLEELPSPQHPHPQKNNLWLIIAFVLIGLGIVGITFAGLWLYHTMIVSPRQDTELDTRAFQVARTLHTEAAYEVYLAGCAANGCGFQAEAIDAIKSLAIHTELEKRDDAAFSQAQQDDTEASYQGYLDNCRPSGCKYKNRATKLRDKRRRDNKAFNRAKQSDTEASYQQYLENCQPNGCRYEAPANSKLTQLRQRRQDALFAQREAELLAQQRREAELHTQQPAATLQDGLHEQPQSISGVLTKPHTRTCAGNLIVDRYGVCNDATIVDTHHELTWKRCSVGQTWVGNACTGEAIKMTWDEAMRASQTLGDGWRMPTYEELRTLVRCSNKRAQSIAWKKTCGTKDKAATINPEVFPDTPHGAYWTASERNNTTYTVGFDLGNVGTGTRSIPRYVRLVRSGR